MKKILYLFFLLLLSGCLEFSFAQNNNKIVDSLFSVLKTAKEDSNKVNLLHDISFRFFNNDEFQQALEYEKACLTLTEKLGMKTKMASSYHFLGYINYAKSDYNEALKNYNAALKIREEVGDKVGVGNTINNIAMVYRVQGKYSEALKNYFISLKIREELDDKPGIAGSLHNIGNIYRDQGNYSEALKNFFASLKIKEKIGDKSAMISTYYVIAFTYDYMNNYPESLKNFEAALALSKEIGDKNEIADAYGLIGSMYNNQGNYPEALKNYLITMNMFLESGNKRRLGITYNNIGTVYNAMAGEETDSLKMIEYYNEALRYYKLDLKLSEELGDKVVIGFNHNNIGSVYAHLKKYDEAMANLLTGLQIRKEIGDKRYIINSYISIGNVYSEMKKYPEARQYLNEGLSLSKQVGIKDRIRELYRSLEKLDSAAGNWPGAYNNYKTYIIYRDSLVNEENAKKAVKLQMQFDFSKKEDSLKYEQFLTDEKLKQQSLLTQQKEQSLLLKEKELALANNEKELQHFAWLKSQSDFETEQSKTREKEKQLTMLEKEKALQASQLDLQHAQLDIKENQLQTQKKQNIFYIIGSILMLLAFTFIYINIRNRQKANAIIASERLKTEKANSAHKMVELELQSLRAQLNPHFMFNSLNAIQRLILTEDNENSYLYLSRFAELLRMLLDNSNQPFITLKKEINFLTLYLSLENLRIPDMKYSIQTEPGIDTAKLLVPNMMLQPYIENAIWHGLSHRTENKNLQIKIFRKENAIVFQVTDNGVGRKRSEELKTLYRKEHRSKGMELLTKRFNLLSKEYGSNIHTTVTDLYDNDTALGTNVEIIIPSTLTEQMTETYL